MLKRLDDQEVFNVYAHVLTVLPSVYVSDFQIWTYNYTNELFLSVTRINTDWLSYLFIYKNIYITYISESAN